MRITIFLLIVFTTNNMLSQTDFSTEIIGKWKFVKVTTSSKVSEQKSVESDPFMKEDILINFRDETAIAFEIENFLMEASYTLKNSLLTIGKYQYNILKITKDNLYFKAKTNNSSTLYEYQRIVEDE